MTAPARRSLGPGVGALALAGPLGGAASFAFHALAARALGPSSYGGLTALLVLTLAVSVPAGAVQVSLARSLVTGRASADRLAARARVVAAGVVGCWVLATPLLDGALDLGGVVAPLALVGYLAATVVGCVPKAVLVANERLVPLAVGSVLAVAGRLAIGAIWLANGGGLVAAVLAGSLSEIAATAVVARSARRAPADPSALASATDAVVDDSGTSARQHAGAVVLFAALWTFLAIDTLAARIALDVDVAGGYVAAVVLVRAVLQVPQAVATAAFARLADPIQRVHALAWATTASFSAAVLGVVALVLSGEPLFRLLFGDAYVHDTRLIAILGAGTAVVAVVNVWIHARVARGDRSLPGAIVILVAGAAAASASIAGPHALAWAMVAGASVSAVALRPRRWAGTPFADPTRVLASPSCAISVVVHGGRGDETVAAVVVARQLLSTANGDGEVLVAGGDDDWRREVEALGATTVRPGESDDQRRRLLPALLGVRGRTVVLLDAGARPDRRTLDGAVARVVDARTAVATVEVLRSGPVVLAERGASRAVGRHLRGDDVLHGRPAAVVLSRDVLDACLPWVVLEGHRTGATEIVATAGRLGHTVEASGSPAVAPGRCGLRDQVRRVGDLLRIAGRLHRIPPVPPVPPAAPVRDEVVDLGGGRDESSLRILVLNWKCSAHPNAGGAESFTHEVIRRWAARGHVVTLFAAAVPGSPAVEDVDGYRIVRSGTRLGVYRAARAFWDAHHHEFDVVVDEVNTRPFEAPLWTDVPVVALVHQLAREVWFRELPAPVAVAGRFLLEPTWLRSYRDVPVLTVSPSSADSLRGAGLRTVVDVGVGLDRGALPTSPPVKAPTPHIAFVGRLVSAKRPLEAIAAFTRVRDVLGDARLTIVGDGPLADAVAALAARTPGVDHLGRVDDATRDAVLASSHALVVTSVREGWGLVVDEAAAHGAVPFGYRVPGLIDSVPAAGGVLVDPTPAALAAALLERLPGLVATPAAPRRGGARDWDDVAASALAVVHAAVDDATRARSDRMPATIGWVA